MRFIVFVVFAVLPLLAQDFRSTLHGSISDPSQASLANAQLTLVQAETNVERTTTTDSQGYYAFQFLPPGTYNLTIKAPGFRT